MQHDDMNPDITAELEAIDATLAGEAVDPAHAELAELALLLRADRPQPAPAFTRELDQRVQERFTRRSASGAAEAPPRPRRRFLSPAFGAAGVGLVATVVAVAALSSGGGPGPTALRTTATSSGVVAAPKPGRSAARGGAVAPAPPASAPSQGTIAATPAVPVTPGSVSPPGNGRKVIQSASIDLGAAPDRVDDVAQEVFNVVGSAGGIVDSSTVTATGGPDGNAQFQLRVPSASLPRVMSQLSRLRYANVLSRTDNTQDVNEPYSSAQKRLADATALRTSLLRQLQNATSQQQIDSLKSQIRDAEASIAAAKSDLARLNSQINHSRIALTIAASGSGASGGASGGGFSLHGAWHDALRVLTVAAGVALIVLAAAVPLALLAALGWWVTGTFRRRRREQALDLA
jgi:hypothetical protein